MRHVVRRLNPAFPRRTTAVTASLPTVPSGTVCAVRLLSRQTVFRSTARMADAQSPPLKILMLHGYTQNGPLFHAKTRALEKHLKKAFPTAIFTYPTAPIRLYPADLPDAITGYSNSTPKNDDTSAQAQPEPDSFGWWVRRGAAEPFTYTRMQEGFAKLAVVLKEEGPFDGVIGFSQGGALSGMLAALLEPDRIEAFVSRRKDGAMEFPPELVDTDSGLQCHPPLKFAVSYSGFGATTNALYTPFYEPRIATPVLHFLGTLDTVVEEARSLRLVESCDERLPDGTPAFPESATRKQDYESRRVVYHPGGHFLPSGKNYLTILDGFIREVMDRHRHGGAGGQITNGKSAADEERVEDMDVPF